MLTDYIEAAMRHAKYEYLEEDGVYYAEIPELPGVWASAPQREGLEAELREALEGWIALGLRLNHPRDRRDRYRIRDGPAARCNLARLTVRTLPERVA